jgi:hypothetical protein
MAAPATTAISTPQGIKLCDGFAAIIMFARDTDLSLWTKTLTPPSFDGGDEIDTTDMHQTLYKTKCPRSLIEVGEISFTASYDPNVYVDIASVINWNDSVTIHFPDLSTLDFYGYLKMFEIQELSEGSQPEANCTVICTNYDSSNRVEVGPVMTEVTGT